MGATRFCEECISRPVMRCGRCTCTFCARHALIPGRRCDACESDYAEDIPTRRAAKVLIAPPIAILVGGVLLGLLMPVAIGGAIGATVMASIAAGTAVASGAGACKVVDKNARALFMRQRAGRLPAARMLPSRTR